MQIQRAGNCVFPCPGSGNTVIFLEKVYGEQAGILLPQTLLILPFYRASS
jgi:hypothetical protein